MECIATMLMIFTTVVMMIFTTMIGNVEKLMSNIAQWRLIDHIQCILLGNELLLLGNELVLASTK